MTAWLSSARAVLRRSGERYLHHRTRRLGASLAYYSIFALIPTLFLALTIVATLFGRDATEGRIEDALADIVGREAAASIDEAVADLWDDSNSSGFAIITALVVIYSASILFIAWRDSLEAIWDVPYRSGLKTSIRRRIYGASGPIAIGILLSAIVLAEMLLGLVGDFITSPLLDAILNVMESVSPTVASVVALALLYRYSTRRRPHWMDVWTGAIPAALALAVLAWGYGLYVRWFGSSSAAGAAGTLILGLAFIYYSAQVLLFGGEIIGASAQRRGHPISPPPDDEATDTVV
ncbi:MAG: YihY/virulence factor BrkB family protein [Ilumatobacteraceae bacterium]